LQLASARSGGSVSLQLVYTLFTINPRLMLLAHVAPHPWPKGSMAQFLGENCMHIAAVNRQERLLCAMISLSEGMYPADRAALFSSKCEGPFFMREPQCFYGGSVLAFAAVHGLKKAVKLLTGRMQRFTGGLNGVSSSKRELPEHYCRLTGFLPIHAVVACNRVEEADFLTREYLEDEGDSLTFEHRADPHQKTKIPSLPGLAGHHLLGLSGMTPLQLAVRLGHTEMFRHLLRWHHTEILWEWGERRAYSINLREIDSPTYNTDVVNLACR
jgi:hypothetical protein